MSDFKEFELSTPDRALLKALTESAGFSVLTRMMEAACRRANDRVIECDDDAKILNLQREARATNAFCNLLRRAINWNVQYANVTGAKPNERLDDPTSRFRPQ